MYVRSFYKKRTHRKQRRSKEDIKKWSILLINEYAWPIFYPFDAQYIKCNYNSHRYNLETVVNTASLTLKSINTSDTCILQFFAKSFYRELYKQDFLTKRFCIWFWNFHLFAIFFSMHHELWWRCNLSVLEHVERRHLEISIFSRSLLEMRKWISCHF